MIITDIAEKLQELLNDVSCPGDFHFVVKSQGFSLDTIANKNTGVNTIPVFVSVLSGENNPVPNLKQKNRNYEINIYFPVRFKEDFFAIEDYLDTCFIAKRVQFGNEIALCNTSIAEYGEITGIQAEQFAEWVNDAYSGTVRVFKKEEDINEPYMSMIIRLYTTTLGDGFMFGNDVNYKLTATFPSYEINTIKIYFNDSHSFYTFSRYATFDDPDNSKWCFAYVSDNTVIKAVYVDVAPTSSNFMFFIKRQFKVYSKPETTYIDITDNVVIQDMTYTSISHVSLTLITPLIFTNSGTGVSVSPVAQQLISDPFAKNISNIVNFNKSTIIYPQNNAFWDYFLFAYNNQDMQSISNMTLTKKYDNGMEYKFSQLVLSANENIQLGEPLSFTLTYGDRK